MPSKPTRRITHRVSDRVGFFCGLPRGKPLAADGQDIESVKNMGIATELTEAGRDYATAYAAHYTQPGLIDGRVICELRMTTVAEDRVRCKP